MYYRDNKHANPMNGTKLTLEKNNLPGKEKDKMRHTQSITVTEGKNGNVKAI